MPIWLGVLELFGVMLAFGFLTVFVFWVNHILGKPLSRDRPINKIIFAIDNIQGLRYRN